MEKRQLKFRSWIIDSKTMVSWEDMLDMSSPTQAECYLNDYFESKNSIMQQYTGRVDKNGKEIYEGDIVSRWVFVYDYDEDENDGTDKISKEETSEIVFRNNGFWVKDEGFGWEGEDLWNWDEIEVIGNIYENLEENDSH